MKLSGHNYSNDVFNSLLDNLSDDIVLKKKASTQAPKVSGMNVFSSTTEDEFHQLQEDELKFIASELQFAADASKISVSQDDLIRFANKVAKEGLKGKGLERAARVFCSTLVRATSAPQGTTRVADLTDNLNDKSVLPAGYNPNTGPNNTNSGGYLGMSKNPNTIWDTDALQEFSQKSSQYVNLMGDEKIAESQNQNAEYREQLKSKEEVTEIPVSNSKVASLHTGQEQGTYQKLPDNSMSMFASDRDFSNIPEKTVGELLKETSDNRSKKSANAKDEWNHSKTAKKTDNGLSGLFDNIKREDIDHVFDSLR